MGLYQNLPFLPINNFILKKWCFKLYPSATQLLPLWLGTSGKGGRKFVRSRILRSMPPRNSCINKIWRWQYQQTCWRKGDNNFSSTSLATCTRLRGSIPACCLQSLTAPFRKQIRQYQLKLQVPISDELAILFLGIQLGKHMINKADYCPVWSLCLWLQPVIRWKILEKTKIKTNVFSKHVLTFPPVTIP